MGRRIQKGKNMEAQKDNTALIVLDGGEVQTFPLGQKQRWMLGRYAPNSPERPDIPLKSSIVSRTHGWLERIAEEWFFVDNPRNLNGTFHNGAKIPRPKNGMKRPTLLDNGDILRIDSSDLNHASDDGVLMIFTTDAVRGEWASYPLGQSVTYIGYDAGGGIAPGPHCAGACAKLTWLNDHYYLFDADAPSGVLLNGAPFRSGALLRERDVISLRGHRLLFLGDRLLYARSERG